jgi:hypothetical protein
MATPFSRLDEPFDRSSSMSIPISEPKLAKVSCSGPIEKCILIIDKEWNIRQPAV